MEYVVIGAQVLGLCVMAFICLLLWGDALSSRRPKARGADALKSPSSDPATSVEAKTEAEIEDVREAA